MAEGSEFVSDGSMENMYKLFKFDQPKGSIAQFEDWFRKLCDVQKDMPVCPWCGTMGELMVSEYRAENGYPSSDMRHHVTKIVDRDRLKYWIVCCQSICPVQPRLVMMYDTPEEAREQWSKRISLPEAR